MKSATRVARKGPPPAPTATFVVKFDQGPKRAPRHEQIAPGDRVPRVARLLALAHRIEGMIRTGQLRDWAEAARLVGVTRARMTQIANLLLLAPVLQETFLSSPTVSQGSDQITERNLRRMVGIAEWGRQQNEWQ